MSRTEKKLRKRRIKVSFEILDMPYEDEAFIDKEDLIEEIEHQIYNLNFEDIVVHRLKIKVVK